MCNNLNLERDNVSGYAVWIRPLGVWIENERDLIFASSWSEVDKEDGQAYVEFPRRGRFRLLDGMFLVLQAEEGWWSYLFYPELKSTERTIWHVPEKHEPLDYWIFRVGNTEGLALSVKEGDEVQVCQIHLSKYGPSILSWYKITGGHRLAEQANLYLSPTGGAK
jgi:hypothetical protein